MEQSGLPLKMSFNKDEFQNWLFLVSFFCYFAILYASNAWVDDFI